MPGSDTVSASVGWQVPTVEPNVMWRHGHKKYDLDLMMLKVIIYNKSLFSFYKENVLNSFFNSFNLYETIFILTVLTISSNEKWHCFNFSQHTIWSQSVTFIGSCSYCVSLNNIHLLVRNITVHTVGKNQSRSSDHSWAFGNPVRRHHLSGKITNRIGANWRVNSIQVS